MFFAHCMSLISKLLLTTIKGGPYLYDLLRKSKWIIDQIQTLLVLVSSLEKDLKQVRWRNFLRSFYCSRNLSIRELISRIFYKT